MLSLAHPRLFTTMVLLDSVIAAEGTIRAKLMLAEGSKLYFATLLFLIEMSHEF